MGNFAIQMFHAQTGRQERNNSLNRSDLHVLCQRDRKMWFQIDSEQNERILQLSRPWFSFKWRKGLVSYKHLNFRHFWLSIVKTVRRLRDLQSHTLPDRLSKSRKEKQSARKGFTGGGHPPFNLQHSSFASETCRTHQGTGQYTGTGGGAWQCPPECVHISHDPTDCFFLHTWTTAATCNHSPGITQIPNKTHFFHDCIINYIILLCNTNHSIMLELCIQSDGM